MTYFGSDRYRTGIRQVSACAPVERQAEHEEGEEDERRESAEEGEVVLEGPLALGHGPHVRAERKVDREAVSDKYKV